MTENIPNDENLDEKVQVFSNTDERLKFLGKILNNDSSRKILLLLIKNEMTANEIATKMNLSLPLAIHHINQMISAEIVVICKTTNNSKNHPMKYYSAKSAILILPEKTIDKAKNSKSLSRSLKGIMKFAVIGIASFISWLLIPNKTIQDSVVLTDNNMPDLTIPFLVIIIGLILFIIKKKRE